MTIAGVYYPLADATLSPTFPLGVSNSFVGKPATVTVRRGTLLIFAEGAWLPGESDVGRRTMIPAD